ncbi:hypothetical protein GDO81_000466 [Engystomops pustulosus]|uniref:FYVE-type domain-containing protein n=1 Tax=Engystomops pustulosus TaxID=76066 RepID=A0AAV7D5W2_ENGPU|nr:hypothetical protein GDO81_000466 [Engystomops pustulosus]
MDTYFQAAVVDLDKLLDDFEQNTDELETYHPRDAPLAPNQSALSSGSLYLEPDLSAPGKPSYGSSHEDTPSPAHANEEVAPVSQAERNVTGPDLLSCVEEGKSNEDESSTGRTSVPICDLISDTGSLLHTASSNESLIPEVAQQSVVSDLELLSDPAFFTVPAPDHTVALGNEEVDASRRESAQLPEGQSNILDLSLEASNTNINDTSDLMDDLDDAREASDMASSIDSTSTSSSSSTDGYVSDDLCYEALTEDQQELESRVPEADTLSYEPKEINSTANLVAPESADYDLAGEIYSNLGACQNECPPVEEPVIASVVTAECSDEVYKASASSTTESSDLSIKDSFIPPNNQSSGVVTQNDLENQTQLALVFSVPSVKCIADENKPPQTDRTPQPVNEMPTMVTCKPVLVSPAHTDNIYSPDFENAILHDFISDHNDLLLSDTYISDAELDAFLGEEGVPSKKDSLTPCAESEATSSSDDGLQSQVIDQGKAQGNLVVEAAENKAASPPPPQNQGNLTGATMVSHIGGARPKQLYNQPPKTLALAQPEKLNNQILPRTVTDQTPDRALQGSANEDTDDSPELSVSEAMERPGNEAMEDCVLGQRQPTWIPDSEAPNCMNCSTRFTFTKRRHHCRACGKVFCAVCCSQKSRLQYLEKEARVCVVCYDSITKGMNTKEQKRVWFADGLLPNGEVADTSKLAAVGKKTPQDLSPVTPMSPDPATAIGSFVDNPKQSDEVEISETPHDVPIAPVSATEETANAFKVSSASDYRMLCCTDKCVSRDVSLLPEDESGLPPLLMTFGESEDAVVENRPTDAGVMLLLEDDGPNPITFILNANLLVNIKLVTYASEKCWFFATNGLHGLGQAEIVVILNCLPNEDSVPKDVFKLMLNIYKEAQKGIAEILAVAYGLKGMVDSSCCLFPNSLI